MMVLFTDHPLIAVGLAAGLMVIVSALFYLLQGLKNTCDALTGSWTTLAVTGTLSHFRKVEDRPPNHYYYDLRFLRDEDGRTVTCERLRLGPGLRKSNLVQYGPWGTWLFLDPREGWPFRRNRPEDGHYCGLSLMAYWDGKNLHHFARDLAKIGQKEAAGALVTGIVGLLAGLILLYPRLIQSMTEDQALLVTIGGGALLLVLRGLIGWVAFRKLKKAWARRLADFIHTAPPRPRYLGPVSNYAPVLAEKASADQRPFGLTLLSFLMHSMVIPAFDLFKAGITKSTKILFHIFIPLVMVPLTFHHFFVRPLFLLRYIVKPPVFEADRFMVQAVGSGQVNSLTATFTEVTLLSPRYGRLEAAKLTLGALLGHKGLIEPGQQGVWLYLRPRLKNGNKINQLRVVAIEREGRLYSDQAQALEVGDFDGLTPVFWGLDGVLSVLLVIKLMTGFIAWNAWLFLLIPGLVLPCLMGRWARHRFITAYNSSLERYTPGLAGRA